MKDTPKEHPLHGIIIPCILLAFVVGIALGSELTERNMLEALQTGDLWCKPPSSIPTYQNTTQTETTYNISTFSTVILT